MKYKMKDIIVNEAFQYDPKGKFVLASGKTSFFHINLKKVYLKPQYNHWLGILLETKMKDTTIANGIGGLEIGAIPLSYAVSNAVYMQNHQYYPDVFIIRKQTKEHGIQQKIEHNLPQGSHVVIVEDVVTTGYSVIQAIVAARSEGFIVERVLSVVDREEGGAGTIKKYVDYYDYLYTKDELFTRYKELKGV